MTNTTSYNYITPNSKHIAKIISIKEDCIVVELLDTPLKATIKFSHLMFPDFWLSSLFYRKIGEEITIKIMHLSDCLDIFVVPTDLIASLTRIKDKSITLLEAKKQLELSMNSIKAQIESLTNKANTLTNRSVAIFRGMKELSGNVSKKIIQELKSERSTILKEKRDINSKIFDLLINLRNNETEIENIRIEIKKEKTNNEKFKHI